MSETTIKPCVLCGAETITDSIDTLLLETGHELARALDTFPPFNSPHEGKAVIEEELDELWEHVKANTGRTPEARSEAIQIAAMALRYCLDVSPPADDSKFPEGDPAEVHPADSLAESQSGLNGPSGSPTSPSGPVPADEAKP